MTQGILTKKRCGILLITACLIYFVLNIAIWSMKLVTAVSGAIAGAASFGLFLYFIREVYKEKGKENAKRTK